MPLLRGRPLKQQTYKRLEDDEEVFFCELTNEIFQNYEEYCERIITCSCCIWSCAITGKSGLTYQEALDSEEKALQNIKDFAPELRTPVLYLASLTAVTHFSDMADIVFHFVKNRYFVGESVQACFENDVWSYAQVVNVFLPTPAEVMAYCERTGAKHPLQHRPYPAELYKYKVEEVIDQEEDDEDDEPKVLCAATLSSEKVRRPVRLYTKDKNRAYLKQFCEHTKGGTWNVKSAIIDKYGISTVDFCDIFVGEPPVLQKLTLTSTPIVKKNATKQVSMKKFVVNGLSPTKNQLLNKSKDSKVEGKKSDTEKNKKKNVTREVAKKIQKKYAASIDRVAKNEDAAKEEMRQSKLEKIRQLKEQKRLEKEKLDRFTKEWQKKREDLECEDLKELPVPCPVDCRVPNHLFGEFIMILEFIVAFKDILNLKDYFPVGLTFEVLERALVDNEIAGPYNNLLQLLLSAIFVFQEDEDDEVKQGAVYGSVSLNEAVELTGQEALKAATQAAQWARTFHNVPLSELHMDAITVTDILRLHLLASGGRAGDLSAKWRLQERGGYINTDDPGYEFRLKEPQILKFLATSSVAALPITDKLKILTCLMNQVLTYASVRDVMDERYDVVSNGKKDVKIQQILEGKKEKEQLKNIKESMDQGNKKEMVDEKQKLTEKAAQRQNDHNRRLMELRELAMGFQVLPLGQDRAHRRYWVFSSLKGLFVEDDEQWPGDCLAQPTTVASAPADEDDTMNYIRKLFEASRTGTGSDKENEGDSSQIVNTPKKKHLGESNGVSLSPTTSEQKCPVKAEESRALVCTANIETCSIHNPAQERTKWLFFCKEDELDELIKNLNKRGHREGPLREILVSDKKRILKHLERCPVQKLNRFAPIINNSQLQADKTIGTRSMKLYEDANLQYPADTPIDVIIEMYLRDVILETEKKIFEGSLGRLKVPNRNAWREAILARSYDCQDDELTWPTKYSAKKAEADTLARSISPFSDTSDTNDDCKLEQSNVVKDLAKAVLQLARCVESKYLQKPLHFEEKKSATLTRLERWEMSLMQSTSYSQVYLHHASLDNSIQWNKSVLNAKCKVCRRRRDDVNMLLCDDCNHGFHLYCLKPKLKSVPTGDWFCPACQRRKENVPAKRSSRRRLLQEEEEIEDEAQEQSDDEPLVKQRRTKRRRETDDSWEEPRPKRGR